jgi:hypothetical protein
MLWNIITTVIAFLATIIAAASFILACISLGWQIYTSFQSKKPKIKGVLSFGASIEHQYPFIQLDLHNSGQVPVFIKEVALCWGNRKSKKAGDTITSYYFQSNWDKNRPLEPGQGCEFFLERTIPHLFDKFAEQPEDKIWVSVKSPKGELLHIAGRDVLPHIP